MVTPSSSDTARRRVATRFAGDFGCFDRLDLRLTDVGAEQASYLQPTTRQVRCLRPCRAQEPRSTVYRRPRADTCQTEEQWISLLIRFGRFIPWAAGLVLEA